MSCKIKNKITARDYYLAGNAFDSKENRSLIEDAYNQIQTKQVRTKIYKPTPIKVNHNLITFYPMNHSKASSVQQYYKEKRVNEDLLKARLPDVEVSLVPVTEPPIVTSTSMPEMRYCLSKHTFTAPSHPGPPDTGITRVIPQPDHHYYHYPHHRDVRYPYDISSTDASLMSLPYVPNVNLSTFMPPHNTSQFLPNAIGSPHLSGSPRSSSGSSPPNYVASDESPTPPNSVFRDKRRNDNLIPRDCPLTKSQIIETVIGEFNELLERMGFDESMKAKLRDIRRRGKNRIAAERSRERKISGTDMLRKEKYELLTHLSYLKKLANTKDRLQKQYEECFKTKPESQFLPMMHGYDIPYL